METDQTAQFPNDVVCRETWESRLRSARRCHDVTPNGIAYHWELAGGRGGDYYLLREAQHTPDVIEEAANYLRGSHDVCTLYWVDVMNCCAKPSFSFATAPAGQP